MKRNNHTIITLLMLLVLLAIALPTEAAKKKSVASETFVNIQELYAETRSGWQGSFTPPKGSTHGAIADGQAVEVDLPLLVPEVDNLPIVELVINKDIFKDDTFRMMFDVPGQVKEDGWLSSKTLPDWGTADAIDFTWLYFPEAGDNQAENNPFTPAEARAYAQELLQKYFRVDNFRIRGLIGYTATPVGEKTKNNDFDRYGPLEVAPYEVFGEQVFEGVPMLLTNNHPDRYIARDYFRLELYAKDLYDLQGYSLKQTGILHEDVPLLPWSAIREIFEEQYLKTGKIVDVWSVELGYELVITRKGKPTNRGVSGDTKKYPDGIFDEIYHVRPIWCFKGYQPPRGPGAEGAMPSFTERRKLCVWGDEAIGTCIDAQTGKTVYHSNEVDFSDNVYPTLLTWSDVKK